MLQHFEKVSPLVESLLNMLYKMRHILWGTVLLGACYIIRCGCHLGRHLECLPKNEELKKNNDGHVECFKIKRFTAFLNMLCFLLCLKRI